MPSGRRHAAFLGLDSPDLVTPPSGRRRWRIAELGFAHRFDCTPPGGSPLTLTLRFKPHGSAWLRECSAHAGWITLRVGPMTLAVRIEVMAGTPAA